MNRGAARADIFVGDDDCTLFIDELAETKHKLGWEVHAYSLMPNHFHLLVRSVEGNLGECMRRLSSQFTRRRNRRTGKDGPVFRGRYRAQLITDEDYLRWAFAYIHLNPVEANLVQRPEEECWTSHRMHTGLDPVAPWLSTDVAEQHMGTAKQFHAFVEDVRLKRASWPDDIDSGTGLRKAAKPKRRVRSDAQSGQALSVDAVIKRVCQVTGKTEEDLLANRMGRGANAERRFAVWMLARHTALTHAEIADRVGGSRGATVQLIHRLRHRPAREPLSAWREAWDASLAAG